ncbi:MAG: sporulation inhibitor of replication protein SirA [Bacilli bacterium]
MRTYYAFIVNEYFAGFYQSKPSSLYKIFEQIYDLGPNDIVLGYRIFEQLATPFNKDHINEYIYNKHSGELSYSKNQNKHLINNIYFSEISKIIVYNSHLKIKSNINYPTFIETIRDFEENIFICDFINKDYFWLDKIKNDSLVKN